MNANKLETLLNRGESPKIDFKAEFHLVTELHKRELARDVIALANTKGGRGYIIYGVEDKSKRIVGIDTSVFKEESIVQVINTRSYPPIPITIELIEHEELVVVVIVVYKSELRPHQMIQNGAFYIRRGSTTDVARREELASMFQENGLFSYERTLIYKVPIEELDMHKVYTIFGDNKLILEAIGIIGRYNDEWHPTIGGLLLFGKNPQDYLSHTYIRLTLEGRSTTISGSIPSMINQVEQFCKINCMDDKYPIEGLIEAVVNAVIHRDYLDISMGITVEVDDRHITVTNPGSLVPGNKLYNNRINADPRRRNAWLYQRTLLMDEDKRVYKYGQGVEEINKAFEGYGSVKYVNLDKKNLFKVVLPTWIPKREQ